MLLNYERGNGKMHKIKLKCLKLQLRDNNIVVYQTYYSATFSQSKSLSCGNDQEEIE